MKVSYVLSVLLSCAVFFSVTGSASAEECRASWYGPGFHGKKMANGKRFNQMDASVVAHKTLPFGTRLRITNLDNGRSIVSVVQDRGPFKPGRCVDVSMAGGQKLGLIGPGIARVSVERL